MAQHDYVISNGTGAAVRSDLNNALAAIVSQNSGATAPSPTYAFQFWADTTAGVLKLRNSANSAWITLFQLDGEWTTLPVENGTAAAPSIYFKDSGTDTGFYSPGTDQVAISTGGTGRLFINSSGSVGIGTSSPSADYFTSAQLVHLSGANSAAIKFERTSATARKWEIGCTTGGNFDFVDTIASASTPRLRIDTSGNVGIGSASPSYLLDLGDGSSNAGFANYLRVNTAGDYNFSLQRQSNASFSIRNDGTSAVYLNTQNSIPLVFGVSSGTSSGSITSHARLDSSGRWLLGTSSDISNGSSNVKAAIIDSDFGALALGRSGTTINSGTTIGDLRFYGNSGNTSAYGLFAQITCTADGSASSNTDNPGRLTFSVTTDGASSPTERMRLEHPGTLNLFSASAGNVTTLVTRTQGGAGTSIALIAGVYNGTGTVSGGTTSFVVYSNGNVVNTNSSYGALSDIKLKENIVDASSQWEDIKALKVRKYNFKEGQTHTQIGVIAQEVEQVSPGLVTESPDKDEEGNELGTVTKSVQYSVLYMKAVKALQEAMERIEQLEAKVAALESA